MKYQIVPVTGADTNNFRYNGYMSFLCGCWQEIEL